MLGRAAHDDDGTKVLELAGRRRQRIEERVLNDQHRGGGRIDEMLEERPAVVDVDRDLHGAEPGSAEPREDEFGTVPHHQQNPVSVSDPEPGEAGGNHVRLRRGLGIGEVALAEREGEERPVGVQPRLRGEQLRQAPARAIRNGERHA